ncbi:hypothetical protein CERSUDRAFT_126403 [Gelatoporia subvermispora B]|uniref:Uncharacterized protein n=1 Tax=Ceriporiopsis subvermispora (strain B) TaxID=914234 RepID=M2R1W9_CERS8|nr:hypothetical protein CERSUDRAFT_126403 [Gelatoporia subvermispora B]
MSAFVEAVLVFPSDPPTVITDSEVRELAESCKETERLCLMSAGYPIMSINALEHFARCCPKLVSLQVPMNLNLDGCYIFSPAEVNSHSESKLQQLQFLPIDFHIPGDIMFVRENPAEIGQFIDSVFPSLGALSIDAPNCLRKFWKIVQTTLSELQSARRG